MNPVSEERIIQKVDIYGFRRYEQKEVSARENVVFLSENAVEKRFQTNRLKSAEWRVYYRKGLKFKKAILMEWKSGPKVMIRKRSTGERIELCKMIRQGRNIKLKKIIIITVLILAGVCFTALIFVAEQKETSKLSELETMIKQKYSMVKYVQSETGERESAESLIEKYQGYQVTECNDSKTDDAATVSVFRLLDCEEKPIGTLKKLCYISSDGEHNLTKHICIEVRCKGEVRRYKYYKNGKNMCDYQIPNV